MTPIDPENDPTSIGNILVAMKVIDRQRLDELVREFKANKEELLGEYICREAKISQSIIDLALAKQKHLRGDKYGLRDALNIAHKSQTRIVAKVEKAATLAFWVKANAK